MTRLGNFETTAVTKWPVVVAAVAVAAVATVVAFAAVTVGEHTLLLRLPQQCS